MSEISNPQASIIVPAYNAAATLHETLDSLVRQTFGDYEIVVVDDGSQDQTAAIAKSYQERCRLRLVRQVNCGLSSARNSGIAAARGDYIGFCDADDIWLPQKLATHVSHLKANPHLGLSYSGSVLIDDNGRPTGMSQMPRLTDISVSHVLKRNPIGNGSALVMRKEALADLAYQPEDEPGRKTARKWVFDENFRQSEDIECWMRLLLTTDWQIEGVPGLLTCYRVNASGLSAALGKQLTFWERMVDKLRPLDPAFFARFESAARAYQFRYLARRAIRNLDGKMAWDMTRRAISQSHRPLIEEPAKSAITIAAALTLKTVGPAPILYANRWMQRSVSN